MSVCDRPPTHTPALIWIVPVGSLMSATDAGRGRFKRAEQQAGLQPRGVLTDTSGRPPLSKCETDVLEQDGGARLIGLASPCPPLL